MRFRARAASACVAAVVLAGAGDAAQTPDTWSATGSLTAARYNHTATRLADGKVLVVGGSLGQSALATAEIDDPATGEWQATGSLAEARAGHTATLLSDGRVLVAGGFAADYLASAEVYDPSIGVCATRPAAGPFVAHRGRRCRRRGARSDQVREGTVLRPP